MNPDIKNIDEFLQFGEHQFKSITKKDFSHISQGLLQGEKTHQTWSNFFEQILAFEWIRDNYLLYSPHSKPKIQTLLIKILILIASNVLIFLFFKSFGIYSSTLSIVLSIYWVVEYYRNTKQYQEQLSQYQKIEKKIHLYNNPAFEGLAYLVDSLLSPLFVPNDYQDPDTSILLETHIFSFFPFYEDLKLPYFNLKGVFLNNQFMQWKIGIENHIPQVHADSLLTFQESQMDIIGEFISQTKLRSRPNLKFTLDFDASDSQYLVQFGQTLEKVFVVFYLFFLIRAYPKNHPLENHSFYQKLNPTWKFMVQVFHYVHRLQQSSSIPQFQVQETQDKCQYNYVKPFASHQSQVYKAGNNNKRLKRKEVIYFQVPILKGQIELSEQTQAVINIYQEIKETRFTRYTSDTTKIEINKRHITYTYYEIKLCYKKDGIRILKNPTAILPNQADIDWRVDESLDMYQIEVLTQTKNYSLDTLPDFNLVEQLFKTGMSLVGSKA